MSDAGGIKVLAICGSLRKGSYNMAALRIAIAQKPPGMMIEVADISQIPLYNEDVRQQGFPPPVQKLREQIAAADRKSTRLNSSHRSLSRMPSSA